MADDAQHPWVRGRLRIARDVLDRVAEHACEGYARDEESCGFLSGPLDPWDRVDRTIPMINRANKLHALDPIAYPRTGRMYFDIDSLKFQQSIDQGIADAYPVKVLYHSHLDVGAYFSETDAAVAKMGADAPPFALCYLVASVRGREVDDHKLFVWNPNAACFDESSFEVVD